MGRDLSSRVGRTEKGNTRRIGKMQSLPVFTKVFGARHEFTHLLEYGHGTTADLGPGPIQTMDRCGTKGGDNRSQRGEVVELTAFLE